MTISAGDIIPGAVLVEIDGDHRKIFVLENRPFNRFFGVTMQADASFHYHEFVWPGKPVGGWYMILPKDVNNDKP